MWQLKPFGTKGRWVFWLFLLLFIGMRVWYFLASGPQSLNQDEAAILANARFLAEVGQDEWGKPWPIVFRSFGDAKLPGYIYTVFLLGKCIGFSAMTVRLPSFIASLSLVVLVYLWTKFITRSKDTGLAAALLLSLSPWSWHYGSLGFEAHYGLVLWLAGLYLLLKTQSKRWETVSFLLLLYSLLTYNSPLLLLPSALGVVVLKYWQKWSDLVSKAAVLVVAGFAAGALTLSASLQKGGISVFQDPTYLNDYPLYRASLGLPILQTILGNKLFYFGSIIWSNWWSHFSWDFLVRSGGENPWHTIPYTGHVSFLLPVLLAFGLGGTIWSVWHALGQANWRRIRDELGLLLLFVWSLVPAAITADAPHATRSLFFFIMATALAARGLVIVQNSYCGSTLPKLVQNLFTAAIAILLAGSFALWWSPAFTRWGRDVQSRWNTDLIPTLQGTRVDAAERVFVLDPDGVLYTLVLLAKGVPANQFLSTVQRSAPDTAGLVRVERFGKYEFVFQASDAHQPGVLLVPRNNRQWDIIEL